MTTPAERVAALTAIKDGIEAEIRRAKADALRVAAEVGVKSFTTPWGAVTVSHKDAQVAFDDDALLAYVKAKHPTEVETVQRVRVAFQRELAARLVAIGDQVMDKQTGEAVDFARVVPAGDDYVTYPASSEQRAAKSEAIAWAKDRAAGLVDGFKAIEAAS